MKKLSKLEKLLIANHSLQKVLTFEEQHLNRHEIIDNFKIDIKAKDEVIGRQMHELDRIYKSKLWQIYLFFKPFLSLFKIILISNISLESINDPFL
jgi:hypothetical protein